MREQRQLERIMSLLAGYQGEIPLQHFLRNYFRQHREMGSNDRRITTQCIYNWFRMGKCLPDLKSETRLAVAAFLVENIETPFTTYLMQTYTVLVKYDIKTNLEKKIDIVSNEYPAFNVSDVFPFSNLTSRGLDCTSFAMGILKQSYLWLRAKHHDLIKGVLEENNIPYIYKGNAIGITRSTALLKLPGLNPEWYEVQDYSSQLTGDYFHPVSGDAWYDCCAASGGKSLLLHSLMPDVLITVSDNRVRILENLKERFNHNGIGKYFVVSADLDKAQPIELSDNSFDGIIADVPCSGSGTWPRSPEQIAFFDVASIATYANRQQRIIQHVSSLLKSSKPLIYITCSVFKKENEEMVAWIAEHCDFEIEKSTLIQGTEFHADTMFVARLIKR